MPEFPPAPESTSSAAADTRDLPSNAIAEQALLGAILINNAVYDKAAAVLSSEHFHVGVHQRIFSAMQRLIGDGRVADPVNLAAWFEHDASLKELGGNAYIVTLANSTIRVANPGDYAKTILDCWLRRELILAARAVIEDAFEPPWDNEKPTDAAEMVRRAVTVIGELDEVRTGKGSSVPFSIAVDEALNLALAAKEGRSGGVATGIPELDELTGGVHQGDLLIIGARSQIGKSALLGTIVRHIATKGNVCGLQSLEMAREAWAQRYLAQDSGVLMTAQRRGTFEYPYDFDKLRLAADTIRPLPIHIDDTSGLTWDEIKIRWRRWVDRYGCRVLGLDHSLLVRQRHGSKGSDMRHELGYIANGCKAFAKETDSTVILLHQLNKSLDAREDKRPTLRDLTESGEVEQAADVIWLLFREEHYVNREKPMRRQGEDDPKFFAREAAWSERLVQCREKLDIMIEKQRQGPVGLVTTRFVGATGVITSW